MSPRTACSQSPNSSAFETVALSETIRTVWRKVDDDLLPDGAAEPVGQVVHLVHDHVREVLQQARVGVEHVAQHLGRHDDDARGRVDVGVAGEQADLVGAVLVHQLLELLVAQRLHGRRVEDLVAGVLHGQVDRELGDDRLARAGRRRDQHAVAALDRCARRELELVEVEALVRAERLEHRELVASAGGGETLGGRQVGHRVINGTGRPGGRPLAHRGTGIRGPDDQSRRRACSRSVA